MFEKHEYVFHESGGICQVADICKSPLDNMPADKDYYILQPVQDANSMIYVPVDSDCIFLRGLMNRQTAEELLSKMSAVEIIDEKNPKLLRAKYIETLRTHEPIEWVRVIKTVEARIKLLAARSQRISETERSFLERAKKNLYGELALSLELDANTMEQFLANYMYDPA